MKIINLQGSKSLINRLLIIATYLNRPIEFINWSNCSDVKTIEKALKNLGYSFSYFNNSVKFFPKKFSSNDKISIQIDDSATALRFLFSRLSVLEGNFLLKLSSQLSSRPHKLLIDILNLNGASIKSDKNCRQYLIKGKHHLFGRSISINSSISSQFISSLLLISPSFQNDLTLSLEDNPVSFSYIMMTIKIMKEFGIKVKIKGKFIYVKKGQKYVEREKYFIEPDFSSGAFFFVLGALKSEAGIFINKLAKNSIQGDYEIINILKMMNANYYENEKILGFKKSELIGISLDMSDYPDLVPILVIAALFAKGKSEFRNILQLKHKESNRIYSLVNELKKIGAQIFFSSDKIVVLPQKKYKAANLETYNDHRICMAFSILKEMLPNIELSETSSIAKSFPEFFEILKNVKN